MWDEVVAGVEEEARRRKRVVKTTTTRRKTTREAYLMHKAREGFWGGRRCSAITSRHPHTVIADKLVRIIKFMAGFE